MAAELHDLSIAELARLIAARKLSPLDPCEALIRRVEQYDGQAHAFITRTFDLARAQARRAEAEIASDTVRQKNHRPDRADADHRRRHRSSGRRPPGGPDQAAT